MARRKGFTTLDESGYYEAYHSDTADAFYKAYKWSVKAYKRFKAYRVLSQVLAGAAVITALVIIGVFIGYGVSKTTLIIAALLALEEAALVLAASLIPLHMDKKYAENRNATAQDFVDGNIDYAQGSLNHDEQWAKTVFDLAQH